MAAIKCLLFTKNHTLSRMVFPSSYILRLCQGWLIPYRFRLRGVDDAEACAGGRQTADDHVLLQPFLLKSKPLAIHFSHAYKSLNDVWPSAARRITPPQLAQ